MAICETEELLGLNEARRFMPRIGGKHPSLPTVWRWCRIGIRGVKLEYVRVGKHLATSKEAVSRFFNALAASDRPVGGTDRPAQPRISKARAASLALADRILERAGI